MKKLWGVILAMTLTVLGVTIPAQTASAHTAGISANCQKLHVNLSNFADDHNPSHKNTVVVKINGSVVYSDPDFGNGYNHQFDFPQAGINTWSVVATAWDGSQYNVNESGTEKPCSKPTQPDPLKVTDTGNGTCDTTYSARTREGVQGWYFDESSWSWKAEDIVWGNWVETTWIDDAWFKACAPDNPGPKASEWLNWSNETPTCDKLTVTQTRTREVTTYVWNPDTRKWVVDKVATETDTHTVAMTDEQYANQCAGTPPASEPREKTRESCTLNDVGGVEVTTGTETYVWNVKDRKWELSGTINWNEPVFTPYTTDKYFAKCAPEKPTKEPLVITGQFGGAQPTCEVPSVEWIRAIATTTYTYAWNVKTRVWDETATESVVTDEVTETHALTAGEIRHCTIPDPLIKVVSDEGFTCDGRYLQDVTTTTPYMWDAEAEDWILDTANAVVTEGEWVFNRKLTTDEKAEFNCVAKTTPDEPNTLALTGGGDSPLGLIGFGLLGLGVLMVVVTKRRKA